MPTGQLEEGRDQLEIRCLADANPPASILWKRTKSPGVTEVASMGETLLFSPIYRNHAAVYICEATNTEGDSNPVSVQVSVNCKCRRPRFRPSYTRPIVLKIKAINPFCTLRDDLLNDRRTRLILGSKEASWQKASLPKIAECFQRFCELK